MNKQEESPTNYGFNDYGFSNMAEKNLCERCKKNPATVPHPCPYADEIGSDNETLCTCCEECQHRCAMDI